MHFARGREASTFPEIEPASPARQPGQPYPGQQLLPRSAPSGPIAAPYPTTLPYPSARGAWRGEGYDPEAAVLEGRRENLLGFDGGADAPTPHLSRLPSTYRPLPLLRGPLAPVGGAAQRLDRATATAVLWLQVSILQECHSEPDIEQEA